MNYDREHEDTQRGLEGEQWVAQKFNLEFCEGVDWCDVENPRTGAKHEVKTALPSRRFRLWKDNHLSLTASDGQNVAWYDFLKLDSNGVIVEHRRMKPSTVTTIVNERGGWNTSGHVRGSKQHKLPPEDVF